jgi:transglutaminase-like putative cysteine protease
MHLQRGWRGALVVSGVLGWGLALQPALAKQAASPSSPPPVPVEKEPAKTPPRPVRPPRPQPAVPVDPKTTDKTGTPAKPGDVAPKPAATPALPSGEPKVGTIVTRSNPRDALVTIAVDVQSKCEVRDRPLQPAPGNTPPKSPKTAPSSTPEIEPFTFTTLGFVFPYVTMTSNMDMLGTPQTWSLPSANNTPSSQEIGFRGRLSASDEVVDGEAAILTGYPAGTKLVRFDYIPKDGTTTPEVGLRLVLPVRCYSTTYDESQADTIAWPGAWPKDVASALQPQMFVEKGINDAGKIETYDVTQMERALAAYLAEDNLNDPKSIPPARLAKLLTGKVWRDVNISGDGIARKGRSSQIAGLVIQPPVVTLSSKRGSGHDASVALVALMRQAGLPARTVIGVDLGFTQGKFLEDSKNKGNLRSWVEFALYDQASHTLNWVPIDITRMRKSSNRPPTKLDVAWKFFGTIDEMNASAPFAFQYVPPTDVATYGSTAAFWGWFVTPKPPDAAEQAISFSTSAIPKTSGAQPEPGMQDSTAPGKDKKDEKKDKKKFGK